MKTYKGVRILLLSLSCCTQLDAQPGSLWKEPTKSAKMGKQKAQGFASKVKQFNDHLKKWGLDSSYNHGLSIGGRLNSNGWTGLVSYQRRLSRNLLSVFQLSFSEIKHEKEIKQQRQQNAYPQLGGTSAFIFGKVNNVYQIQMGYGREYLVLPGVLDGNISVGFRIQGGLSITALKPYYLQLLYVDYTPDEHAWIHEEAYSVDNAEKFLNVSSIQGKSQWKKGFDEIGYIPGVYLDAAVTIEPLKNKTFIKTVSLGANFSFHSKDITIMAHQKNYPWSACLYASLQLGKRWR